MLNMSFECQTPISESKMAGFDMLNVSFTVLDPGFSKAKNYAHQRGAFKSFAPALVNFYIKQNVLVCDMAALMLIRA